MKIAFNPLTGQFDLTGDGAAAIGNLKGQVANVAALPSSGNTIGDVWQVAADLTFRAWNGTAWVNLGTLQGPAGADASYSNATPQPLGAAAASGSANSAARGDHVHQRDADVIVLACSDETTALTTGTNRVRFRMPYAATLLAVRANVNTAPTGSALIVDINEAGVSVLGTKLSIDATEFSSTTAASAATITDSNLADDAEISIDIDQVGSTVAGAGLKVMLSVRRA